MATAGEFVKLNLGGNRFAFARAKDLEYEVSNARIWGGIHFRSAVEDGIEMSKKTAHQVLAHHFKRSHD